jgi:glycosyltransferase involved in cell wall biosynthesis
LQAIAGRDLLVADEAPQLAEHILNLLSDPELCRRIGENGRKYVCAHHDWNQIAKKLVNTYEDVIIANHR